MKLDMAEEANFFKKLLAREDDSGNSFKVKNGRDRGVGVAFAWEVEPGISRFHVCAAKDSLHSVVLNPPPFQVTEYYIEENSSGGSSTRYRKWALFYKILDSLSTRKIKKKSKHVVGETSTRKSNLIMPARRSIIQKSHSLREFLMPRKSI